MDELARAVFLIGIPFPPLYDRYVVLKKEYMDRVASDEMFDDVKKIDGDSWY